MQKSEKQTNMQEMLDRIGKVSLANLGRVKKANRCACYYCCSTYPAEFVKLDHGYGDGDNEKATVWCPLCGIDSVYCDQDGLPMTDEFITAAYNRSFRQQDVKVNHYTMEDWPNLEKSIMFESGEEDDEESAP